MRSKAIKVNFVILQYFPRWFRWTLIPGTTWHVLMTVGCDAKTRSNRRPEDGRVGE